MKFGFKDKKKKKQKNKDQERAQILEFVQNNAAKKDFIAWLNANYGQQFPEDASWDKVIKEAKSNSEIHNNSLHNYASTLTNEEDVTKLLKDVEKETTKAEETVSELYDSANSKRLQPVIGGASLLGGFLLLIAAAGLMTGITELGLQPGMSGFLASISMLYGVLNVFSGLLLVLK